MPPSATSCRDCSRTFSEVVLKQKGRNFCVDCWVVRDRERRPTAEERKETDRRYYEANRDKSNSKSRAHYAANKDHLLAYAKEYRENNKERIAAQKRVRQPISSVVSRRWFWATKYGLTIEQAELMLKKQGFVCAICEQPNPNGRHLAVDHCHKTGKVRGFLCSSCNFALGGFRDDPELLRRASQYISANIRSQT